MAPHTCFNFRAGVRWRRLVLLSVFLGSVLTMFAEPVTFNIPAQKLPSALELFMKQANVRVMFAYEPLAEVRANEVQGAFEVPAAIDRLLGGTGFVAQPTAADAKTYVIAPAATTAATGTVEGTVILGVKGGGAVQGASVSVRGTPILAVTNSFGRFVLSKVPAGQQTLQITGEHIATLLITKLDVRTGRRLQLDDIVVLPAQSDAPSRKVVEAENLSDLVELDPYVVTAAKPAPFSDRNVDLPRGVDDPQAYFIFNSKEIEQSGAVNIEDFLKRQVTMSTSTLSSSQIYGGNVVVTGVKGSNNTGSYGAGTTSIISLRGLSFDQTLILIDGRRVAGVSFQGQELQPDLNGLSLAAIDRIEILPAGASAIYGGSAVGGVVNIILKKDYTGGQIRYSYDSSFGASDSNQAVDFNYGIFLEHGRTRVTFGAGYVDSQPVLLGDELALVQRGLKQILANYPSLIYSPSLLYYGNATNVKRAWYDGYASFGGSGNSALVLKSTGQNLGTSIAYIPAGYNGSSVQLVSSAGAYNLDQPNTAGTNGLQQPLGMFARTKSFNTTVRREMTPWLEAFTQFNTQINEGRTIYDPVAGLTLTVPSTAPTNPYNNTVDVTFPSANRPAQTSTTTSRNFVFGLSATLPHDWRVMLDYTWSQSLSSSSNALADTVAINSALGSGKINPFVDTAANPIDTTSYLGTERAKYDSTASEWALRAAGPLFELPFLHTTPTLAGSVSLHASGLRQGEDARTLPYTNLNPAIYGYFSGYTDSTTTWFGHRRTAQNGNLELEIPLIAKNRQHLFLNELNLQLAGRIDRSDTSSGTSFVTTYPKWSKVIYDASSSTGNTPTSASSNLVNTNGTVGFTYRPVRQLMFRVSYASAFLPPTYLELTPKVTSSLTSTVRLDSGQYQSGVTQISGGNPDLQPESSREWDYGVVFEPEGFLHGWRASLDAYHLDKHNAIVGMSLQDTYNARAYFPDRVVFSDTGRVVSVDTSLVNIFRQSTSGANLRIDYRHDFKSGALMFAGSATVIEHLQQQYTAKSPTKDYVGWVSSNGPLKTRGNVSVMWETPRWSIGWRTNYYSGYKQYGQAGDPTLTNPTTTYVLAQGSNRIPGQIYHDIFGSYRLPAVWASSPRIGRLLSHVTLSVGVNNVFGTLAPVDVYYAPFYYSPFGDRRVRTWRASLSKEF